MRTKLDDIEEWANQWLDKITDDEDDASDDDPDYYGRFGGNIDDAYYGGLEDGENEGIKIALNKLKKYIKEIKN